MKTVVFLGNFEVPYSTESHHAWSFEKLGWQVIRLQENRTWACQVKQFCQRADLLAWTHTHSWDLYGDPRSVLDDLKIPSYSYHLDRYWGIGSREGSYLDHPSFHLQYFFSTDGGNDERWKKAGINHQWLLPGVVEYLAYRAEPRGGRIPLLFTGSENYHGEYPFRKQMVDAVRLKFGQHFVVRGDIREHELNVAYANADICIGDHIFAGQPRYCSDRLFESIGRGAFIIYPETEGITEAIPGLATYKPQNINDLFDKIEYFRIRVAERQERQRETFEWARQNATYTHRIKKILEVLNLA